MDRPRFSASLPLHKGKPAHAAPALTPRAVGKEVDGEDCFTLRDGSRGGVEATLRNLVVDPELAPGFFALKVPEGYTRTAASAP